MTLYSIETTLVGLKISLASNLVFSHKQTSTMQKLKKGWWFMLERGIVGQGCQTEVYGGKMCVEQFCFPSSLFRGSDGRRWNSSRLKWQDHSRKLQDTDGRDPHPNALISLSPSPHPRTGFNQDHTPGTIASGWGRWWVWPGVDHWAAVWTWAVVQAVVGTCQRKLHPCPGVSSNNLTLSMPWGTG